MTMSNVIGDLIRLQEYVRNLIAMRKRQAKANEMAVRATAS